MGLGTHRRDLVHRRKVFFPGYGRRMCGGWRWGQPWILLGGVGFLVLMGMTQVGLEKVDRSQILKA